MKSSLEDAEDLAVIYKKRFNTDEITNYVYNENEAFLAQEIAAIKGIIAQIEGFSAGNYQSAEDAAAVIAGTVHEKSELFENPEAVDRLVKRKIQKILAYIEMGPEK
jgi:hypothetical protein